MANEKPAAQQQAQEKDGGVTPTAKIISRKVEFDGWHRLETVVAQPRSLKHGGWADEMAREVMRGGEEGKIACVLLYIPETDEILLNEQFRMGAMIAGAQDPFLFECAAGFVDAGETPAEAATREALEETGTEITALHPIGIYYTSPGCLAEEFHIFIGRIAAAESGIYGMAHEGEEIKTHLLTAKQALQMLDENHIRNAVTSIALHWFARNKEKIRKQWLEA
ncbi:MAG: NUDIX domain-containing protein [Alphaproteobacteria bacterium]|nr:NUDIX domain-containing protein [Alphaproteobacteria bacterium]